MIRYTSPKKHMVEDSSKRKRGRPRVNMIPVRKIKKNKKVAIRVKPAGFKTLSVQSQIKPSGQLKKNVKNEELIKSSPKKASSPKKVEETVTPASPKSKKRISYLPVNYNDFKESDKVGGLLENNEIGCAAVNLKYKAIVMDSSVVNPCIYYVLQGSLIAEIEGKKKLNLARGDFFSINRGQSYQIKCKSKNSSKLLMSYSK